MFVIADAHVTSTKEYHKFMNIVKELSNYDDVILLGDILDFTRVSISELWYNCEDFDEVIYIKGNHDIIADKLDIPCYDFYEDDSTGLRFEHGHRFESLLDSNLFLGPEHYTKLFERLCYARSTSKSFVHKLWEIKMRFLFGKRDRNKLAYEMFDLMQKIGNIVCGHCHKELIDTETRTFILSSWKDNNFVYHFSPEGKKIVVKRFVINKHDTARSIAIQVTK